MRKIFLVTLFLCYCFLSTPAQAQDNFTDGTVWRVNLYKVKPGKMSELLMEMRQNLRPLHEEYKKQGLIVDYKLYTNSTTDSSGDWSLALAVGYKNWAALDDLARKADPITLKHYGTREKRQEAQNKRNQLFEVVSSRLMREITLNPLP